MILKTRKTQQRRSRKMKIITNTILAVTLATLIALPFIGDVNTSAMAQEKIKATKVNSASVPPGTYNLDPAHSTIVY